MFNKIKRGYNLKCGHLTFFQLELLLSQIRDLRRSSKNMNDFLHVEK
jgi:hypothetical protein